MKLGLGRRGLSFGGSGGPPKPVTDFFNGFELGGSIYSGGPTVVADNTGTLVTSPAGVLPIEGMRLATTVADGAVLGPERLTDPAFSTGISEWKRYGIPLATWTGSSMVITGTVGNSGGYYIDFPSVFSKVFHVSIRARRAGGSSALRLWYVSSTGGFTPNVQTDVTSSEYVTFEQTVTSTGAGIRVYCQVVDGDGVLEVDNVSVREVIPTWLPTTSLGAPIHPSTPLRTRKGTVSVYGEDFRGPLIEPARTNLFLNSTTPVTQNITTTAQAYTVTVLGTGSITLSGTATGTATQGSPLTVTASAGTLTCTVTGTLTRVNVEAGAFGTSFIDTAATTVTRDAKNLTRPTAGTALASGNDFAVYGRVVPKAGGQTVAYMFTSYVDGTNGTEVRADPGNAIQIIKRMSAGTQLANLAYTHAANTPFEYLAYLHSVHGMGIAVRSWNGSAWSAWSAWATNANTANAPIASTYQIGARNNTNHFAANYPFTKIIQLNPALNPQSQLADMLAKGRI